MIESIKKNNLFNYQYLGFDTGLVVIYSRILANGSSKVVKVSDENQKHQTSHSLEFILIQCLEEKTSEYLQKSHGSTDTILHCLVIF